MSDSFVDHILNKASWLNIKKANHSSLCHQNLTNRMTKGAILCLKNIPTGTSREQIKETWNKYSPVAYIEFNTGETEVSEKCFILLLFFYNLLTL